MTNNNSYSRIETIAKSLAIIATCLVMVYAIYKGICVNTEWVSVSCPPEETDNGNPSDEPAKVPDIKQPRDGETTPVDEGEGYEDLKEDEAKALVKEWLEAKPEVYGSSYNRELARAHVNSPGIDAIYNDISRLEPKYYWKYDKPSVLGDVRSFEYFSSLGTAELVITVNEYKSFYTEKGRSASDSGEFARVIKYTFGRLPDKTWKIADIVECQESCM